MKDSAEFGVVKYLEMLYLFPTVNDNYYVLKSAIIKFGGLLIPILCTINLIHAATTTDKVLTEDIIESLAIMLSVIVQSIPSFYVFLYAPTALEELLQKMFDFSKFGRPKKVTAKLAFGTKLGKYFILYVGMVVIIYSFYGLSQMSNCRRVSEEHDLKRSCGLPIPILFVEISPATHAVMFTTILISVLFPPMSAVGMEIYVVFGFEITLLKYQHLKEVLIEMVQLEDDREIERMFRHCVRYHIDILDTIVFINAIASKVLMLFVLLTSIIIGIVGYQTLISDNIYISSCHLCGWIGGIFLICFSGQRVINENATLVEAFSNIPWYNKKFQLIRKDLRFVLRRCQIDVGIDAGPFGHMHMELFKEIMKTAYSCLALFLDSE